MHVLEIPAAHQLKIASLRSKDAEWKGGKDSIRFEKMRRFEVATPNTETSCGHELESEESAEWYQSA